MVALRWVSRRMLILPSGNKKKTWRGHTIVPGNKTTNNPKNKRSSLWAAARNAPFSKNETLVYMFISSHKSKLCIRTTQYTNGRHFLRVRRVMVMVLNPTFNNISVISWRSDLLVEETGVSAENQRPVASHWHTFSHNIVSSTPHLSWIRTHNIIVAIGTDFIYM